MRRPLTVLCAALLLLGAAACSDDDDGSATDGATTTSSSTETTSTTTEEQAAERAAYVDATVEATRGDSFPASEDELRCMAEGVVDAIGVTTLQDAGISPAQLADQGTAQLADELSEAQADEMGQAMVDCFEDPVALFAESVAGGDPETTACLEENLDEADLVQVLASALLRGGDEGTPPELVPLFQELADACPGLIGSTGGTP